MTTYTEEHRTKLEAYLAAHELPSGLGDEESACTVAAINLALSGKLTDDIPDCMSDVLGNAAIRLQDAMPDEMRNSARYKSLIPNMPGTGRTLEKERVDVLMDWMWTTVLPQLQPITDKGGFGAEWRTMSQEKTVAAANAATAAADDSAAAYVAAYAVRAAAAYAANAAAAAYVAAYVAAYAAAYANAADNFWVKVDPIGVLERMTYLGEMK